MNVAEFDCNTLLHQNSSLACPHDEREKTARLAFRGKAIVFDALAAGTLKTLGAEAFSPCRADMGIIRSAALLFCGAVKKVAVSIVSYVPVSYLDVRVVT